MVRIYTLTLAPSLDSATITPQIYPEGNQVLRAGIRTRRRGINVARAIAHLGGTATAIFPAGGATGEHLVALLADENVPVSTVDAKTGRVRTCTSTSSPAANSIVLLCPAPRWTMTNFASLKNRYWKLNPGQFWLSAAAFRPALRSRNSRN